MKDLMFWGMFFACLLISAMTLEMYIKIQIYWRPTNDRD